MFKPLELFVGLRYIRAKRRNQFISFISFSSMIGITLGVTVLITVLSVMNGFVTELRDHAGRRRFSGCLLQRQISIGRWGDEKQQQQSGRQEPYHIHGRISNCVRMVRS